MSMQMRVSKIGIMRLDTHLAVEVLKEISMDKQATTHKLCGRELGLSDVASGVVGARV